MPLEKPIFRCTSLAPLLAGEANCEYKAWMNGHHSSVELNRLASDFDSAGWKEKHAAYLNKLRDEYGGQQLLEGQTDWEIEGKAAAVKGKMDLILPDIKLVVDAKTGKPKDSHIIQMKIYLWAIENDAVAGVEGDYTAILRYSNGHKQEVRSADKPFKERLFALVRKLSGPELKAIPSSNECKYCDLAECQYRVAGKRVVQTAAF